MSVFGARVYQWNPSHTGRNAVAIRRTRKGLNGKHTIVNDDDAFKVEIDAKDYEAVGRAVALACYPS